MEIHLQHLLHVNKSPISNRNERNRFNVSQEQRCIIFRLGLVVTCCWRRLGRVRWRDDRQEGGKKRREGGRGTDTTGGKRRPPAKSLPAQDVNRAICQGEGFYTFGSARGTSWLTGQADLQQRRSGFLQAFALAGVFCASRGLCYINLYFYID